MMENVVEIRDEVPELELDIEEEKEVIPEIKAKEYAAERKSRLVAKLLGGCGLIVAFLLVPFVISPGLAIVVLLVEVYLLDWMYSILVLLRDSNSFMLKEYSGKNPENEIDRITARPGPKDHLIR
jgi:hypothetical protein